MKRKLTTNKMMKNEKTKHSYTLTRTNGMNPKNVITLKENVKTYG